MNIGRKIYYETLTGKAVYPPLESRSGEAKETNKEQDFLSYPSLKGLDPFLYDVIQLAYGEREKEIENMGSMHVDPFAKTLTIYPKLSILTDKSSMLTTDTATITVTTQNDCEVNFQVNDGESVPKTTTNKQTTFTFQSDVPDTYTIKASAELYGTNSVEVTVNA